ncbi:MAG: hypothetical protein ABSG53_25320 [Thermoguttaceae bacterium]|jgi:hypothetical protein
MRPPIFVPSALASLVLAATVWAAPAGQVQLEIAGDVQLGAGMSFQQWGQALNAAGIQNFRLRSAQGGEKPAIEVSGTRQMPFYKVTAVLGARDELVVPGGRFRRSECKKLAAWLDDLAKRGPPEKRENVSAFGLTASQLEKVNSDLSKAVGFSTKGMTRSEAVNKIAGRLGLTLKIEDGLADGDDKIDEELTEFSSGTALACVLRPIGSCMVPRASGETLSYAVKKAQLDQEIWPVGWPAESAQKVLPALYEFHNVNVSGVTAAKLLEVVGKQVNAAVLYDHNALARHGIEPNKTAVSHPQQRTTYSVALRKMLGKIGLKFEVRVDEAGKPFLWVSSLKPV